ncbi:unnamed protein product [Anisakis simplex]|uniref:Glutamyl-tRNA(Gln) amidotransferase subunit C, mitochondrial n=1 Tax=Anisakis simplex TaxID=6269 RepID=A0A0M3K8T9_ANISI|nr:unnamed protein product [Anisakis simplex]
MTISAQASVVMSKRLLRTSIRSVKQITSATRIEPSKSIAKNEPQCSYVPREPCTSKIDESLVEEPPVFDKKLITHLERLSLVRFSDEEAVAHLRKAVKYANQLKLIDTTGVEPMETVLENLECPLREDKVEQTVSKQEILSNAVELVEDYFVTPPGNIPLEESPAKLDLRKVNEWDWLAMDKKN